MFICTPALGADNDELWDFYPSRIEFRQYAGTALASEVGQSWFSFDPAVNPFSGTPLALRVEDGLQDVTLEPAAASMVLFDATADWQWTGLHSGGFASAGCQFTYTREIGAVLLPFGEGYRLGQRETLAWTGPPTLCPDQVAQYLERAKSTPVMPLHVVAWQTLATPAAPANTGRIEISVIHDIRRTLKLLPLEATAEVLADPLEDLLASMGDGPARLALIRARLGPDLFRSGFE